MYYAIGVLSLYVLFFARDVVIRWCRDMADIIGGLWPSH